MAGDTGGLSDVTRINIIFYDTTSLRIPPRLMYIPVMCKLRKSNNNLLFFY